MMHEIEGYYVESIDQSLLCEGMKTFRASAVITEPYVMANEKRPHKSSIEDEMKWQADNFDRVVPSHWMNTLRSFAVLIGKSPRSLEYLR
jgi:hypothetical protein